MDDNFVTKIVRNALWVTTMDTPDEFTELCLSEGWKGIRYSATKNPIALMLDIDIGPRWMACVGIDRLSVIHQVTGAQLFHDTTPFYHSVWLGKFNKGEYPDLLIDQP